MGSNLTWVGYNACDALSKSKQFKEIKATNIKETQAEMFRIFIFLQHFHWKEKKWKLKFSEHARAISSPFEPNRGAAESNPKLPSNRLCRLRKRSEIFQSFSEFSFFLRRTKPSFNTTSGYINLAVQPWIFPYFSPSFDQESTEIQASLHLHASHVTTLFEDQLLQNGITKPRVYRMDCCGVLHVTLILVILDLWLTNWLVQIWLELARIFVIFCLRCRCM